MNVIETIIDNREKIMEMVTRHGVISLKLYGSVLARKETLESDIDFLAIFDPNLPYDWNASFNLHEELEKYFGRNIGILDSRNFPDVFLPTINVDPVDIMKLERNKQYTIMPKSSHLYYKMLDRVFNEYGRFLSDHSYELYGLIAEKVSWWFSRLLRLEDNDLRKYEEFNFIEVLALCEKVSLFSLEQPTEYDLERFEELMGNVEEYVQLNIW